MSDMRDTIDENTCPWRKASDLHQKVLELIRKNQAIGLMILNAQTEIAELKQQQAQVRESLLKLYRISDAALDGEILNNSQS